MNLTGLPFSKDIPTIDGFYVCHPVGHTIHEYVLDNQNGVWIDLETRREVGREFLRQCEFCGPFVLQREVVLTPKGIEEAFEKGRQSVLDKLPPFYDTIDGEPSGHPRELIHIKFGPHDDMSMLIQKQSPDDEISELDQHRYGDVQPSRLMPALLKAVSTIKAAVESNDTDAINAAAGELGVALTSIVHSANDYISTLRCVIDARVCQLQKMAGKDDATPIVNGCCDCAEPVPSYPTCCAADAGGVMCEITAIATTAEQATPVGIEPPPIGRHDATLEPLVEALEIESAKAGVKTERSRSDASILLRYGTNAMAVWPMPDGISLKYVVRNKENICSIGQAIALVKRQGV